MSALSDKVFARTVRDEAHLRDIIPSPDPLATAKVIDRIDDHVRRYIANCSYAVLSTSGADGDCDASPRGGGAGFISIIDEQRLIIPESTGNRRADSLRNIIANPSIGMLLLIPGYEETLRINGRAFIIDDAALLARYPTKGKVAPIAIGVLVSACYLHCAKASLRASLWNPMGWPDLTEFPSAAEIFRDHSRGSQGDGSVIDMERMLHLSYTQRI